MNFYFTVRPFYHLEISPSVPSTDFTVHDLKQAVAALVTGGGARSPTPVFHGARRCLTLQKEGRLNQLSINSLVALVYTAVSSIPLDCHEPQVGGSVVQRLVILMIDVLPQRQRSHPQRLAHDLPCVMSRRLMLPMEHLDAVWSALSSWRAIISTVLGTIVTRSRSFCHALELGSRDVGRS